MMWLLHWLCGSFARGTGRTQGVVNWMLTFTVWPLQCAYIGFLRGADHSHPHLYWALAQNLLFIDFENLAMTVHGFVLMLACRGFLRRADHSHPECFVVFAVVTSPRVSRGSCIDGHDFVSLFQAPDVWAAGRCAYFVVIVLI